MLSADVKNEYHKHISGLVENLWDYRREHFQDKPDLFDDYQDPNPPVFRREHAQYNVLVRPGAGDDEYARVRAAIPSGKRHRWFRSMKSSQALAQSVFANLRECGKLALLAQIVGDDGEQLFPPSERLECQANLESEIDYLGERRPTSVDVLLDDGSYRVAIECKLTEADLGPCSQPPNGRCSGRYDNTHQSERCVLTANGVAYWEHVPALFHWQNDHDYDPCPIQAPYQLVRNVLAACLRPGARADAAAGHAVLLYDRRNPHCSPGGDIYEAYETVRGALKDPSLLRLCTWQQVTEVLKSDREMAWLVDALHAKYGF